jgi:hypothetical protein
MPPTPASPARPDRRFARARIAGHKHLAGHTSHNSPPTTNPRPSLPPDNRHDVKLYRLLPAQLHIVPAAACLNLARPGTAGHQVTPGMPGTAAEHGPLEPGEIATAFLAWETMARQG